MGRHRLVQPSSDAAIGPHQFKPGCRAFVELPTWLGLSSPVEHGSRQLDRGGHVGRPWRVPAHAIRADQRRGGSAAILAVANPARRILIDLTTLRRLVYGLRNLSDGRSFRRLIPNADR